MTRISRLQGIVVPTITPFRENGEIEEAFLAPYLNFVSEKVQAISVCAIYGAGIMMRPDQRMKVAEIAVNVVGAKSQVAVFVGAPDTDTAVLLAKHAEKVGANAVTCVAPFYYRQVDEALFRHFHALIQSVDLPVYVYDSPVYAGNQLSIELLKRLADHGLAGVITGAVTFGIEHIWSVMRSIKNDSFGVFSIRDGLALPAMMNGAAGFESGVANFFPELVVEFYNSIMDKEYSKAAVLQDRMLRLRDISHGFGRNIPTLHALISMRGFQTGVPRKPFYLLNNEEVVRLQNQLNALDFYTPFTE